MKTKLIEMLGWLCGQRARVLLYHSISDSPADAAAVTPRTFAEQLAWLARQHYQVITASALLQAIQQQRPLRKTVALTFDDAYADFYDAALPILQDFGFAATLFVPTGYLGQVSGWNVNTPPRPVMIAAQLARVAEHGHELGSHTVGHFRLPALAAAPLWAELHDSREYLLSITGGSTMTLAYPFGQSGARELAAAERAGYSGAFVVGGLWSNGRASQRYALTREMLWQRTDLAQFQRLVTGAADLSHLYRDLRRPRPAPALERAQP